MDFSKNDLSKAQKGDQLWNYFAQIWETVAKIEFGDGFPIKFESRSECDYSGRETKDDTGPTYFWNEIHFDIPAPPRRMMKKKIEFWHVYKSDGKLIHCFDSAVDAEEFTDSKNYFIKHYTDEIEVEE